MNFSRLLLRAALLTCGAVTAFADPLQPLGDEFSRAESRSAWNLLSETEGWTANQLELWDVNTSRAGFMRMVPFTSSWYGELRGVLVSKDITGDFVATARLRVRSRHNPGNPLEVPGRLYTLAGIFARAPRNITQGAPVPYTTAAVWPPAANGSQWTPGGENYIFLSYGTAGNPGTRQCEIKSTRNSASHLYFHSAAVPQGATEAATEIWLQMVRIGSTVVCLRKHSEAGPWIVENRYPNPDHPFPVWGPTVQVGITTYTDWESVDGAYYIGSNPSLNVQRAFHHNYTQLQTGANAHGGVPHAPDLICDIDSLHFQRPDPALTEAALQALQTTYAPLGSPQPHRANPALTVRNLPASGTGALLGDAADTPLGEVAFSAAAYSSGELSGTVSVSVHRTGSSAGRPLSLRYTTVPGTALAGADFTPAQGILSWAAAEPAEKLIVIPLAADTLAEGAEAFTVTLDQLDGPATFPASVPQLSASVTVSDHPFDQWRRDQFGAGNASLPGFGPGSDPDSDGLPTLLEYGLGTQPSSPDALPLEVSTAGSVTALRFTAPAVLPGATLRIQSATGLSVWTDAAVRAAGSTVWTSADGVTVSVNPQTGEVTALVPAVDARRFYRIEVTRA